MRIPVDGRLSPLLMLDLSFMHMSSHRLPSGVLERERTSELGSPPGRQLLGSSFLQVNVKPLPSSGKPVCRDTPVPIGLVITEVNSDTEPPNIHLSSLCMCTHMHAHGHMHQHACAHLDLSPLPQTSAAQLHREGQGRPVPQGQPLLPCAPSSP